MKKIWHLLWKSTFPFDPAKWPFFYGWAIMVVAMLGIILSIPGQTMGVGPFKEELMFHLSLDSQQLSWAYFFGTCVSGLTLPWAGRKIDQLGVRFTMVVAGLLFSAVLFLHSQLQNVLGMTAYLLDYQYRTVISWTAIALGFLLIRFLGQGILTICCRTMLSRWFHLRRGLVYGVGGVIGTMGFGMAPWVLTNLVEEAGWLGAYKTLAIVVVLGTLFIAWLFFRETPEDCGLRMDGLSEKQTAELEAKQKHDDLKIIREMTQRESIKTYAFWVFNIGLSYWGFYSTGFTFHMVSVGSQLGLEDGAIAKLFIPISIVSVLSNLFFGYLADKVRLKRVLMVMLLSCFMGNLGTLWIPSQQAIGTWIMILGLGISGGIFGVLSGVVWARFYGRKHLAAVSSVFMSTTVIGSALGPLFFAEYERWFGSYEYVYITSSAILLFLAISTLWADNPQRKLK